jgi:hypothetical protein
MKLSESDVRSLIREAINEQSLEALFQQAKTVVIDYIDHPDKGENTFKAKLNKKLKKLGKPPIDKEAVRKIKKFITDTNVKIVASPNWPDGRAGQYDVSIMSVELRKSYLDQPSHRPGEIIDTIYHELYHALDTAYSTIKAGEKSELIQSKQYRKKYGTPAAQADMEKELQTFLASGHTDISLMSKLFIDELKSLIDKQVLQSEKMWNDKNEKLFVDSYEEPGGRISDPRIEFTPFVLEVLSETMHIYVAVQQLRRIFPGSALSQICALPKTRLSKLDYWQRAFLIAFSCTRETDDAFESIAKSIDREKIDSRTV